jgi:sugar phosphate isomerase/epimerase
MTGSNHRLRFAYSTINWGATCDIPQALADIRDAGWQAVDVLGTPSLLESQLAGLVPATLFAGIELPDSGLQRRKLRNQIRFASEIGARDFGLVGGGRLRWRPPDHDEYAALAALCEDLATHGAGLGVTVSYHPHVACTIETSDEIATLMAQTSALRLCLDASHIALVGEDPLTVIDQWWDRLGYLHLKDWGNGKFQELGRGAIGIDFPAILGELQRRQFDGWVVLEQSQSDISPLQSARINAGYLTGIGHDIALP